MGKTFDGMDERIQRWMREQKMFFVATSPLAAEGSVNLSPKGNDTLRVLDEHTIIYQDSGGSGIETVAHLRENQRIVIMMCSFGPAPKIFRFHGHGRVYTSLDKDFRALAKHFGESELGFRNIIKVDVTRVSDSCGYGVPLYDYQGDRTTAMDYAKNNDSDKIRKTLEQSNANSIDGLNGLSKDEAHAYLPPSAIDE